MAFRKLADITPQVTTSMMATDAMQGLRFRQLINVVEAHVEGRPDIDPALLRAFAHRMDRLSDRIERERKA